MKRYLIEIPENVNEFCSKKVVEYVIKNKKIISKQKIFNMYFLDKILEIIDNEKI